MKIKMLQFKKTYPMTIFIEEDHAQQNFSEMPVNAPIVALQRKGTNTKPNMKKYLCEYPKEIWELL